MVALAQEAVLEHADEGAHHHHEAERGDGHPEEEHDERNTEHAAEDAEARSVQA